MSVERIFSTDLKLRKYMLEIYLDINKVEFKINLILIK